MQMNNTVDDRIQPGAKLPSPGMDGMNLLRVDEFRYKNYGNTVHKCSVTPKNCLNIAKSTGKNCIQNIRLQIKKDEHTLFIIKVSTFLLMIFR